MPHEFKPPSAEIIEASRRLSAKFKRENFIYTVRLDLAREFGLDVDPQVSALFDQAMQQANNNLIEARAVFRELVKSIK